MKNQKFENEFHPFLGMKSKYSKRPNPISGNTIPDGQ